MPRRERNYIPGYPYHIVQRGNNREATFFQPADYTLYLGLWQKCARRYGVKVHAYCLMTNHVHFVATPNCEAGLSNTLKVVASRYAYHTNKLYGRTGTLWEGRHRSSLIQTDKYLLSCYRYVELNPVRAGMVNQPADYQWSSYGVNGLGDSGWIEFHEEYINLGKHESERRETYRNLCRENLTKTEVGAIRTATHYGVPVADDIYCRRLERKFGLKPGYKSRGRPLKHSA